MPRQVVDTDRAPASDHYAHAVRSGDLVPRFGIEVDAIMRLG